MSLVLARDLSGPRAVADALHRSQAQLAEAQLVAHIGSWDWDMVTDTIRWSEEMYRLSGVGPSDAPLGFDAYMAIIHADDRDEVVVDRPGGDRGRRGLQTLYRLAEIDGGERVIEGTGTVTLRHGGEGRVDGWHRARRHR